jgi:hypothetical protein
MRAGGAEEGSSPWNDEQLSGSRVGAVAHVSMSFPASALSGGRNHGWFLFKGQRDWARACAITDQRHRASCVLAGINKWGECITGIAASKICELLQFG